MPERVDTEGDGELRERIARAMYEADFRGVPSPTLFEALVDDVKQRYEARADAVLGVFGEEAAKSEVRTDEGAPHRPPVAASSHDSLRARLIAAFYKTGILYTRTACIELADVALADDALGVFGDVERELARLREDHVVLAQEAATVLREFYDDITPCAHRLRSGQRCRLCGRARALLIECDALVDVLASSVQSEDPKQ